MNEYGRVIIDIIILTQTKVYRATLEIEILQLDFNINLLLVYEYSDDSAEVTLVTTAIM